MASRATGDEDDPDLRALLQEAISGFEGLQLGRWDLDDYDSPTTSSLSSFTALSASTNDAPSIFYPSSAPTPVPMPPPPSPLAASAFALPAEKGKKLCFVCRLQLTSCDDEHVRGKKHVRKAALLGLPPNSLGLPEHLAPASAPASASASASAAAAVSPPATPLTSALRPDARAPPPGLFLPLSSPAVPAKVAPPPSQGPVVVPCFICRLGLSVNDVVPHVHGKSHHHK